MANIQGERRWIIDTASATVFTTRSMFVHDIQLVSTATSPAGRTVITDSAGVERAVLNGEGSQYLENWWWDGSKVTVHEGGLLYINTK